MTDRQPYTLEEINAKFAEMRTIVEHNQKHPDYPDLPSGHVPTNDWYTLCQDMALLMLDLKGRLDIAEEALDKIRKAPGWLTL